MIATTWYAPVDAEAEQGEAEVRDVVHVPDDDLLAPRFNSDGAATCYADFAVVGEGDVLIVDAVVIDERPVEGSEVVGGAAVEDGYVT